MTYIVANDSWRTSFPKRCVRVVVAPRRRLPTEFRRACSRDLLPHLKAIAKYRKSGGKLKCQECVQRAEKEERETAAAKRSSEAATITTENPETRVCSGCNKELDFSSYNRNQWNKGPGKSKCRSCVEQALAEEHTSVQGAREAKLQSAREKVAKAKASGNAHEILRSESELAALEAEKVTGWPRSGWDEGAGAGEVGTTGRGDGLVDDKDEWAL